MGLFVGGRSSRMGGRPKGLLRAPDGSPSLAARTIATARRALPACEVCLVGTADDYAALGHEALADEPPGIGPLGGLAALLRRSEARRAVAVALACDHPWLSEGLLARLAAHAPAAAIVAPRRDGRWEPLVARYEPARVLPLVGACVAADRRSLQGLLGDAGALAVELPLAPGDERDLADWDTPEDLAT